MGEQKRKKGGEKISHQEEERASGCAVGKSSFGSRTKSGGRKSTQLNESPSPSRGERPHLKKKIKQYIVEEKPTVCND